MKRSLRGRLTYANIVSTLCLFLVLGGGASYAASQLGKNSIGPKQLKKNSITSAKLQNGAVSSAKLAGGAVTSDKIQSGAIDAIKVKDGSLGIADLQAGTIPPQTPPSRLHAAEFPQLVSISSATTLATLILPAGNYLVQAKLNALHPDAVSSTRIECVLLNGSQPLDFVKVRLQKNEGPEPVIFASVPMMSSLRLAASSTISLLCASTAAGTTIEVSDAHLTALSVGSINGA